MWWDSNFKTNVPEEPKLFTVKSNATDESTSIQKVLSWNVCSKGRNWSSIY